MVHYSSIALILLMMLLDKHLVTSNNSSENIELNGIELEDDYNKLDSHNENYEPYINQFPCSQNRVREIKYYTICANFSVNHSLLSSKLQDWNMFSPPWIKSKPSLCVVYFVIPRVNPKLKVNWEVGPCTTRS